VTPIFAHAGDVFFTRSESLLGRAIRWAERDPHEEPTWANHTGVVVEDGWIAPPHWVYEPGAEHLPEAARLATVVEALWHVRYGPLQVNGIAVRVFRPEPALTLAELMRFRLAASKHVGEKYGWWRLLMHLADRVLFGGRKVVSNIALVKNRPVCSYLAAEVYSVVGINFGMEPAAATPDEMLDWVASKPGAWREIR